MPLEQIEEFLLVDLDLFGFSMRIKNGRNESRGAKPVVGVLAGFIFEFSVLKFSLHMAPSVLRIIFCHMV
jgi:hypothetical protein